MIVVNRGFPAKMNHEMTYNSIDICLKLEPQNLEYLYAKLEFLLKQKREKEASEDAKFILEYYPDLSERNDLINFIESVK